MIVEFIDKVVVQLWFVNLQFSVGQQVVMIEMFNIVVFIGVVIVLNVNVVFFYCCYQYGVGDCVVQWCGVEVG